MNPQLIITAVVAAAGFATGAGVTWEIMSGRQAKKELAHEQQKLAEQRQSAASAIRHRDNAIQAQSDSARRDIRLRADADAGRDAVARLRDQTADNVRIARADPTTCPDTADTLGKLLGTVAQAGAELAAKADRHANDAKTLTDAYPK